MPTLRWSVPEVILDGDVLVAADDGSRREVTGTPAVLDDFLRLDDNPRRIAAMARRIGLLHVVPNDPQRVDAGWDDARGAYAEPVTAWGVWRARMAASAEVCGWLLTAKTPRTFDQRRAVGRLMRQWRASGRLHDALGWWREQPVRGVPDLSRWIDRLVPPPQVDTRPSPSIEGLETLYVRPPSDTDMLPSRWRLPTPAMRRHAAAELLNAWLVVGRVRPAVRVVGDRVVFVETFDTGTPAFSALTWLLVQRCVGDLQPLKRCESCGQLFTPRRVDAKFCKTCGRPAAAKAAKLRYRQKLRDAGKTTRERLHPKQTEDARR